MLLIPAALAVLITVHLAMIMRQHHSQFPGPGRRERNVVGTPMWPAYALRSIGLLLAVAAVLFLLGGLVQINPIWQWGPYHPYLSENGAQPDWYIGWLIGALRLMPNFEPAIGGHTIIPNPFWGGALFPLVVFGVLFAWPALERRITGDRPPPRPARPARDRPIRTAIGAGVPELGGDRVRGRLDRPDLLPPATSPIPPRSTSGESGIWVIPILVFFSPAAPAGRCSAAARTRSEPGREKWSAAGPTARWR